MDLPTRLRRSAMNLLARREHSRHELADKLRARYRQSKLAVGDPVVDDGAVSGEVLDEMLDEMLAQVLDRLEADGLLSDARFAEAYVRSRTQRGFGPLSIRYDLRQRGIAAELIDEWVPDDNEFWLDHLDQILRRKYDEAVLTSAEPRMLQKIQRFVVSRGFSSGHWSQWRRN